MYSSSLEMDSRRIHFAGVTSNPNQTWITQQARQLVWDLHDRGRCLQFLIHDNDCSFSKAFDAVFESEGISIIHTPFQAPNANAHAERWVRTVREECLDHILIINAEHLQRVLIEFSQYYNTSRPIKVSISMCPFPTIYLRTLALFNVERYSAELSTITFVHRTAASFPPFDFIFVQ
jgi:putative transposase